MLDNQRREFIILAGAAGLLLAAKVNRARGQQPGMPVIGFLGSSSAQVSVKDLEAFRKGLSETGYLEGRNVASNSAGPEGGRIECRNWRPIWSADRWQ